MKQLSRLLVGRRDRSQLLYIKLDHPKNSSHYSGHHRHHHHHHHHHNRLLPLGRGRFVGFPVSLVVGMSGLWAEETPSPSLAFLLVLLVCYLVSRSYVSRFWSTWTVLLSALVVGGRVQCSFAVGVLSGGISCDW